MSKSIKDVFGLLALEKVFSTKNKVVVTKISVFLRVFGGLKYSDMVRGGVISPSLTQYKGE